VYLCVQDVLPFDFITQEFLRLPDTLLYVVQTSPWQWAFLRMSYMQGLLISQTTKQGRSNASSSMKMASFAAFYGLRCGFQQSITPKPLFRAMLAHKASKHLPTWFKVPRHTSKTCFSDIYVQPLPSLAVILVGCSKHQRHPAGVANTSNTLQV